MAASSAVIAAAAPPALWMLIVSILLAALPCVIVLEVTPAVERSVTFVLSVVLVTTSSSVLVTAAAVLNPESLPDQAAPVRVPPATAPSDRFLKRSATSAAVLLATALPIVSVNPPTVTVEAVPVVCAANFTIDDSVTPSVGEVALP